MRYKQGTSIKYYKTMTIQGIWLVIAFCNYAN